jgi:hypothetical protein
MAPPKSTRGASAKTLLKLGWEYPTYVAPGVADDSGKTVAPKVREALSREAALTYIARDDLRPLLVLRECKTCNGTDDALLSRANVDNEKTFLLSRWFHCVKLPVDVMQKDHPFHNLFADENPEHMFLCTADGTLRVPLESERSRVELWDAMSKVLKASYASEPEAAIRKMERAIDAFDEFDSTIAMLEKRADEALETEGPDSKKFKKAKDEVTAARKERDALFKVIDQATSELRLKPSNQKKAADQPKKG